MPTVNEVCSKLRLVVQLESGSKNWTPRECAVVLLTLMIHAAVVEVRMARHECSAVIRVPEDDFNPDHLGNFARRLQREVDDAVEELRRRGLSR
jgi:hypothetical protein